MRRAWRMRAGLALVSVGCALSACQQTADNAQIRALQSSGPVAFLCLSTPTAGMDPTEALAALTDMARPLDECGRERTDTADDYTVPHLYTLVTQPISGEVAVVDLTTLDGALLDQNPAIPGASFLPIGATPTDIVTTPGGFAAFVTSAEPNFESIYALPASMVRGSSPRLTSWPSCRLPATPESMVLVVDPVDANGDLRRQCDGDYAPYTPVDLTDPQAIADACEADPSSCCIAPKSSAAQADVLLPHCHGDLWLDAEAAGTPGSYKLAVTLPAEGGIAIIDAQALLDQDAGAAEACVIERWLPLQVDLPAPLPPPDPTTSQACVDEPFVSEPFSPGFEPLPGGMTLAGGELFIADRAAPVIHRMQLQDPCAPVEIAPLLATSSEDPARVVTTRRVAVSPLTLDLKRFLYAIDEIDGSVMMFDVSDDATDRRPLSRPNPSDNPFQPPDRVRFQAPPRDIVIVRHDNDTIDGTSGGNLPVRCDPTPAADDTSAAEYRTSDDFQSGARPELLRGVFAFAVLASGDIVAIDIDDYDAACRGPKTYSEEAGCVEPFPDAGDDGLRTSGEYSCNVVAPHQARAEIPLGFVEGSLNTHPGLTAFPLLFDSEGALLKLGEANANIPRMRAPNDAADVIIGPDLITLEGGVPQGDDLEHALAFQLRDPRAHILDQIWTVTYEGALPGFGNRFAQLTDNGDGTLTLREVSSRFCNRGVLGQAAWQGIIADESNPSGLSAAELADYVQIVTDSPIESDSYWDQQSSCTFNTCQNAYGSSDAPAAGRDLRIVEATDDTLQLEQRAALADDAPDLKCCFPSAVAFRVRVGGQWAVVGNSVGFLHHVITNDAGQCRLSCDDQDRLLNGRVRAVPADTEVSPDNPLLFQNPFFRFAINDGDASRDMNFQLTTQRPFRALSLSVVTNDQDVQPVAIRYLGPTGELVVSDGSLEGITLLDLNQLTIVRQYN